MALIQEDLSKKIIGAAIEVHRILGPGLLESAYQRCLCHELHSLEIPFKCELPLPIVYKGVHLDCGYRIDLLVNDSIIVEIKSVETILPIHEAQLLTYLRLTQCKVGLLMNFNVQKLIDGITRRVL